MSKRTDEHNEQGFNALIKDGHVVMGLYDDGGVWVTGRVQRLRRRSAIVWQAQPWDDRRWRELKSYRQVWVDRSGEDNDAEEHQ